MGQIDILLMLILAGVSLLTLNYRAYARFKDPLHPVMFLAPLFIAGLVIEPVLVMRNADCEKYFPGFEGIPFALAVQYLGMGAFFLGVLRVRTQARPRGQKWSLLDSSLTPQQKGLMIQCAWLLCIVVHALYWYSVMFNGGFFRVYSVTKGIANSPSGYVDEFSNLAAAVLVIYALGCQGRSIGTRHYLSALLMIAPILIQGTFGGRRGPLFLSLFALYGCFWLAKGKMPKPRQILFTTAVILTLVLFVQTQRAHLYLGSGQGINWETFFDALVQKNVTEGDNFIVSCGGVLATTELGTFHYGRRYFLTFIIRPIPRQLWRTKYDDVSEILYGLPFAHVQNAHYGWSTVLGWRPTTGYAVNSIVDMYIEFSWGYLIALFFFGYGIGYTWKQFRERGGYWFVVYFAVAALSIYLPTQSFSAFAYRFLYIAVMTFIFWQTFLRYVGRRRIPITASLNG